MSYNFKVKRFAYKTNPFDRPVVYGKIVFVNGGIEP